MTTKDINELNAHRQRLNFAYAVTKHFDFVREYGFSLFESMPTMVRYRKDDFEVRIYHGQNSYEIGVEIGRGNVPYPIGALIRLTDERHAEKYRNSIALTPASVMTGVQQAAELLKQYGQNVLRGDISTFAALDEQKVRMAKKMELDSIAAQLRPKAEAAFRNQRYREAAELYERIRPILSATELKKFELAKERAEG